MDALFDIAGTLALMGLVIWLYIFFVMRPRTQRRKQQGRGEFKTRPVSDVTAVIILIGIVAFLARTAFYIFSRKLS